VFFVNYFVQDAFAQSTAASQEPSFASFLPLIILFVVFYFFLIRPQMKKTKEHAKMVNSLAVGDEIVSVGGLFGKITALGDNFVQAEVATNVSVKIQKSAVAQVMPAGTDKVL
jgi:preprotein translocase subunit YajC